MIIRIGIQKALGWQELPLLPTKGYLRPDFQSVRYKCLDYMLACLLANDLFDMGNFLVGYFQTYCFNNSHTE